MSITFITPTYFRDFDQFSILRDSIKQFAPDVNHMVVIHTEDKRKFLERFGVEPKLQLVTTEELLPSGAERSRQKSLESRLAKHFRKKTSPYSLQGWEAQQCTKICALASCPTETGVFIDSDVFLCQPFDPELFEKSEKTVLYRDIAKTAEDMAFIVSTHQILGHNLEQVTEFYNYIFQPASFRASTGRNLLDLLTSLYGEKWPKIIAKQNMPSEFNLLGYCAANSGDKMLYSVCNTAPDTMHYSLRYSADKNALDSRIAQFEGDAVKRPFFLMQSNLNFSSDESRAAYVKTLACLGI